jgi:hypothetical protein
MRKGRIWHGFLSALLSFAAMAVLLPAAQSIIENPARPKAANAGRIVVPEEVLTISDDGTRDYYFDVPHDLRIAADGSLFLLDKRQILQFDRAGKFLHNLYNQGQGPGEMSYVRACLTTDKNVIVHTDSPDRIIFLDYAGKYEREIPFRLKSGYNLNPKTLLFEGGTFYIQAAEWPRVKGDPEDVEIPNAIFALNSVSGETRELSSFSTRSYAITSGRSSGLYEISSFFAAPFKGKYVVLSHTSEYSIKIYDPSANKVIQEFRRTYERVKPEPPTETDKKGMLVEGKRYPRPEHKYQSDVKVILTYGDEIWAVTSTRDEAKGVLIDVFDSEGVYRDCFYLKLPEAALNQLRWPGYCTRDGDFLWVVERTEDETVTIKKYRVVV